MVSSRKTGSRGFTLIELLIVIAIIAIIAGVAFVALDPLTRFADARDSARWTDVTAILTATKVDQVDNGGNYSWYIQNMTAGTEYQISSATTTTGCDTNCSAVAGASDCVNLQELADEGYVAQLPVSPNGTGTWDSTHTGYYALRSTNNSITVGACEAENTPSITVTR